MCCVMIIAVLCCQRLMMMKTQQMTISMQILLMDINKKMPTFPHKVCMLIIHSVCAVCPHSSYLFMIFHFWHSKRSTSKNDTRFLANGLGSAVLSDCDDNKNNGARSREMSSILGTKRRRNG